MPHLVLPHTNMLTSKQDKMLKERFDKNYIFAKRIFAILPSELSFEDKLKSISLNLNFKKHSNIQFSIITKKAYSVVPSKDKMDADSPMQYEIRNKKGERIAVFNFFLVSDKNRSFVRTNNIKGLQGKKYLLELNFLNKNLRTDWRIIIAKTIKNYFERKNIVSIFEIPRMFTSSEDKYIRYLGHYFNTAVNAGYDFKNIDFRYLQDNNLKNLFNIKSEIITSDRFKAHEFSRKSLERKSEEVRHLLNHTIKPKKIF